MASIEDGGLRAGGLQPGEWYLDTATAPPKATLYYAPLPPDRRAALGAVLPLSEGLLHSEGAEGLEFVNVTFEHDTWHGPSGPDGYVEQQSGALVRGAGPHTCEASWEWAPANGSLHFERGRGLRFEGCTFRHLGSSSALSLMGGSSGNLVSSAHFYDISGASVQIGRNDKWAPDTPADERESRNVVSDSLVEWAAIEFHGQVGLQVGHAEYTTLERLELRNLTYGGLSVGWGWARHAASGTYSSHNNVSRCSIHDFKKLLGDGGGIFALGPQPGGSMQNNWVHRMASGRGGGAYYPDEGSTEWQIGQSVFSDAAYCSDDCQWLHIWTSSIRDLRVQTAWTDTKT
jgi:hypothetical protein